MSLSITDLHNGAAAKLLKLYDEIIKLAVGENALLPARVQLKQALQVSHLQTICVRNIERLCIGDCPVRARDPEQLVSQSIKASA